MLTKSQIKMLVLTLLCLATCNRIVRASEEPEERVIGNRDQEMEDMENVDIQSHYVTHYDCAEPSDMELYSTTIIDKCQINPEDIQTNIIQVAIYN